MLVIEKIARERRLHKMSLAEFGDKIGVDKATASIYEKGILKTIPLDVLHKIADTFECEFDELVADDPKYCMLASVGTNNKDTILTSEDKQLLIWYHSLPKEIQNGIKHFWNIPIKITI